MHAHLDMDPVSGDCENVLARASDVGVKAIIANGVDPESNRRVTALSQQHDIVKPALGMYPSEVADRSMEEIDEEIAFIRSQKPVAIGEVGLDYAVASEREESLFENLSEERSEELRRKQGEVFLKFIDLSMELDIPIIVHSRKAENDAIELLTERNAKKVVMHCFMGKKKYVRRIQEQGWMFSIPVVVTKLQQMQDIVATTGLSYLLTETDTPFLGPYQGVSNEPANIRYSISKIAELKGLTEEEASNQMFMNYMRMFM